MIELSYAHSPKGKFYYDIECAVLPRATEKTKSKEKRKNRQGDEIENTVHRKFRIHVIYLAHGTLA